LRSFYSASIRDAAENWSALKKGDCKSVIVSLLFMRARVRLRTSSVPSGLAWRQWRKRFSVAFRRLQVHRQQLQISRSGPCGVACRNRRRSGIGTTPRKLDIPRRNLPI